MQINNLYNFKNPVKNFLNIGNIEFSDDLSHLDINRLCWVEPFNFRVRKQGDQYRTLKMPNLLNFMSACAYYKDMPYFNNIQGMDRVHKRLSANIETGDFSSGEYDWQLEKDFENLCVYDNLIKLDVKEYYGRIYTHKIDFQGLEERYISNMNLGATNGLIMGNYLSLYFAERYLACISKDIEVELNKANIDCDYTYFSDDFYFFCNVKDNEKIIHIFDKVLEKYELERSERKKEVWTYESFNNHNLVARYWKKLIAHCNIRFKSDRDDNKLYFINQIVYRMSKLDDEKMKKVFINNIFKTKYFRELPLEKYQVKEYDYHQLCFIMKYSPESMLYLADRFSIMKKFDNQKMHKFFKVRYHESLRSSFNDEQLYYFYAIKLFGFEDIIGGEKEMVLKSNNQILISYYLKDNIFTKDDLNYLKSLEDEKYWFQNYHMIMYDMDMLVDLEDNIEKYLIPKKVLQSLCNKPSKVAKRESYMNFYMKNLSTGKAIIRDIEDVKTEIINYLELKIAESEEVFEEG
ncbi:hypothetical protein [Lachnoclostridium phytofermentans]|uniref:hypothetical protein n=2 Tax=Lachnoclostridium phytofermentans TaxID=66219 RepID=UPI000495D923|nr:hypothetical protein [Lachnoclostridium phytofermentans]